MDCHKFCGLGHIQPPFFSIINVISFGLSEFIHISLKYKQRTQTMIEKNINGVTFLTAKWPLSSDKATLVFIHGAGDSSFFWENQIKGLSDEINVIGIDLPGHGRSVSHGMDTIEDYADMVDTFIKEANIPSPIPCGLSMGGAIVLQLLLDGESDYKAGITINSGARLKVMPMIFDMINNDFQGYVNSLELFAVSEKTEKVKYEHLIEDLSKMSPETVNDDFRACDSFNIMERLEEISVPVLVMTAEDDKLTPPKYGEFLAETINNSSYAQISNSGHMSPVENPDEVNKAIQNFLNML